MNNCFALAPWADVLHAGDARWWLAHPEAERACAERWTLDPMLGTQPGMSHIEGIDEPGISEHPTRVHTGGNSGYSAIGLAALWGADRVTLLGYDMGTTGGRLHWHPDHDEKTLGNPVDFQTWRDRLAGAAADLRRLGVHVVNASRETALACFERMPLERALAA